MKVAEVRALYADTDQMGVVNNGVYLRWFEIGRAEWLRARGLVYRELEERGLLLPVIEAQLRYRQPARYDDLVSIEVEPRDVRAASFRFVYRLTRSSDGLLLCEGRTAHACLDAERRVVRVPAELGRLLRDAPGSRPA